VYCLVLAALLFSGCASVEYRYRELTYEQRIEKHTVLQSLRLDPALEEQILALDPERLTEKDVREVLGRGPAPRIINLHGGIPLVYLAMESFSEFLVGMGYPEGKVRNPGDGTYSYSPYKSSAQLAGLIAWHYEKEGMPVMLVGHSMGGIQVVKVLHELAGAFSEEVAVWNPLTEEAEDRHAIIDPITGAERPVVGVRVGYATAVGAGGLARLLQWGMLGKLRTIPDTVEHFTGFSIGLDLIGGDFLSLVRPANEYAGSGAARVRNVVLPAGYNHVTVPATADLAQDKRIRDWVNAYIPTDEPELTVEFEASSSNILWAADVWHSVKKQWCLEAQRLIRARRDLMVITDSKGPSHEASGAPAGTSSAGGR
jgi:hypothetical protein